MSEFIEVTEDVTIIETDDDHVEVIESSSQAVTELSQALSAHKADISNPHAVTKAQVGLGSVDNTSDMEKPVSTAQQAALDTKVEQVTGNTRVYITNGSGAQTSNAWSDAPNADTFARRTTGGQTRVGTAVLSDAATTKAQMEAADALKVDRSSTASSVYTSTSGGTVSMLPYSSLATPNSMAYRTTGGVLNVGIPTANGHAVNLEFLSSRIQQGTGFPNGVVTAPVGSIYIDTAATNGAISWIKASGTGNTGWVVEYGDTGWRNITSTAQFGWGAVEIRVRRVNENVYWGFEALNAAAMTNIQFMTAPVGFGFISGSGYADRQFLTTAASPAQVWRVTMGNTGAMQVQGAPPSVALLYGSLVSTTTGAWPTTLPGTAL